MVPAHAFKKIYEHFLESRTLGISWAATLGLFSLNTNTQKKFISFLQQLKFPGILLSQIVTCMAINQQLITLKYIHLITWEWDEYLFCILNKEQSFEVVQGSFSKPFQTAPVTLGPVPQYWC